MQRLSIIDAGLASAYEDEPLGDGTQRFRSRFHLVDATTDIAFATNVLDLFSSRAVE
jgi:hypothetical protein